MFLEIINLFNKEFLIFFYQKTHHLHHINKINKNLKIYSIRSQINKSKFYIQKKSYKLNCLIFIYQNYIIQLMHKRKIDINELKRTYIKGKKFGSINVKQVLAYFKQKQVNEKEIFEVSFVPLISDLLNQFNSLDMVSKLQNGSKEPIKEISIFPTHLKLDSFNIKRVSSSQPLNDLAECLYIHKDDAQKKIVLGIIRNKLMLFFKNLRMIYSDFCFCVGEKFILQTSQLKNVYGKFKSEWIKNQQKGKSSNVEKVQKKIACSLYFLGVLIENNIFSAIQERERKQLEEQSQFGTKSQKKRNIKGPANPASSTYSIGSNDFNDLLGSISIPMKSQKSNNEDFAMKDQYSQKSEKIRSKPRISLFSKAQIKNLKVKIPFSIQKECISLIPKDKDSINYLSTDVENIKIDAAFKLQKFKDGCLKQNPYYYNYAPSQQYQLFEVSLQNNDLQEMQQLKRSFDFYNLVETKKNINPKVVSKHYN